MREHAIQNLVRIAISRFGKYFRVNVGQAWTGDEVVKVRQHTTVRVQPGDVVIRNGRPLSTGLPKGFSDIVGGTTMEIRPEHVGMTLSVLTLLEVKAEDGRLTPDQKNFQAVMKTAGALVGVVRSEDDALALVGNPAAHLAASKVIG